MDQIKDVIAEWAPGVSAKILEELPNPPDEPEKARLGLLLDGTGYVWVPHEKEWVRYLAPDAAEKTPCERDGHRWVHQDVSKSDEYLGFQTRFTRTDFFFCEKCLDSKEKKRSECSRDTPDWHRAK